MKVGAVLVIIFGLLKIEVSLVMGEELVSNSTEGVVWGEESVSYSIEELASNSTDGSGSNSTEELASNSTDGSGSNSTEELASNWTDESESNSTEEIYTREVPGWGKNVDRRTTTYIDPVRDTTLIGGREICQNPETKVVIVVESTSADARMVIRETWANLSGVAVKVGFLVGLSNNTRDIRNESLLFNDIIQESFIESYENLTIKGISMLKWFTLNCPHAEFLVKADEDTYVHVPRLTHRLDQYRNVTGVLRGYLCHDFDRDQDLWSKYYTPEYMYPGNKYPDFLQGSAYYMSRDVAEKLFKAALKAHIFHLEDVYITGICAKIAEVHPQKDVGVVYLFGMPVDRCITTHTITCNMVPFTQMRRVKKLYEISEYSEETIFTFASVFSTASTTTEKFIYYTENDTAPTLNLNVSTPMLNLNVSAKPRNVDIWMRSASPNKYARVVTACAIHLLWWC